MTNYSGYTAKPGVGAPFCLNSPVEAPLTNLKHLPMDPVAAHPAASNPESYPQNKQH